MRSISKTNMDEEYQYYHHRFNPHLAQHKPKYHTIHRTDVSRIPTLEHLKASFYIKPISTNHYIKRELTVEPVTFREDFKEVRYHIKSYTDKRGA
jgi:hypothetical protein